MSEKTSRSKSRSRSRPVPRGRKPQRAGSTDFQKTSVEKSQDGSPDPDPPDPETIFPNYRFGPGRRSVGIVLWLSNLLAFTFLTIVALSPPGQMDGGIAILKSGEEFVGPLRRCTGTTCDPYMAGASSEEGGFGYGNMFLTLGVATLTALWFSIFIILGNIYRFIRSRPPVEGGNIWDQMARFGYRAPRALSVVNVVLIPSLMVDVVVKGISYRSAKNITGFNIIGGGIALYFFAFLFTLLATLIELRGPEGRTHRWIAKMDCFSATPPPKPQSPRDLENGSAQDKEK